MIRYTESLRPFCDLVGANVCDVIHPRESGQVPNSCTLFYRFRWEGYRVVGASLLYYRECGILLATGVQ